MKTFIMSYDPMGLHIRNFERVSEELLLKQIISSLSKQSVVKIGKKMECPSEDLYNCKFKDNKFTIIYSLDDGVSLRFNDKETLQAVKNVLENA